MTLTPEQFNKLATKEDLKDFYTKSELDVKLDKILNAIDGLTKKVEVFQSELSADRNAHDRVDAELSAHDMRIGVVEKKLQIA